MIKESISILCVFVSLLNYKACEKQKDQVLWRESRKLVLQDFQGAIKSGKRDGESSITILCTYVLKDYIEKFDVKCVFVKGESWLKDTSAYVLNHEQVHFDIGEIVARQLRKSLIENKYLINKFSAKKMDSLYHLFSTKFMDLQKIYDEETQYSFNVAAQFEWDLKVSKQLDSLKAFRRKE